MSRSGVGFSGWAVSAIVQRRRGTRFTTTLNAHYDSGSEKGTGVLENISYSGALIENSSARPTVGSRVRVYVFVEPVDLLAPASPYELLGRVVRHSFAGFAIEYEDTDPEVLQLVDKAAASQN